MRTGKAKAAPKWTKFILKIGKMASKRAQNGQDPPDAAQAAGAGREDKTGCHLPATESFPAQTDVPPTPPG